MSCSESFGTDYLEAAEAASFAGGYSWQVCIMAVDGLVRCRKYYTQPV